METDSGASAPDEVELVLMWTCPDCGTMFRRTDQPHSCDTFTVQQMLDGKPEAGVAAYHALEKGLLAFPGVDVRPVTTRILFQVDGVSFASVEKITRKGIDVSFALTEAHDLPGMKRVFRESSGLKGHTARVATQADVDALMPLLREARALQAEAPQG